MADGGREVLANVLQSGEQTVDLEAMIQKIHVNLGRSDKATTIRVLKTVGAVNVVLRIAQALGCPICAHECIPRT